MKNVLLCMIFMATVNNYATFAQTSTLYFPPNTGNVWETLSPATLGWCEENIDTLFSFLENTHTKAFIVLKDGKIVLEEYFGTFTQDSLWYWASAGKTMTGFLTGIAQQEGSLAINDPTSDYLGNGWTSCPANKEALITLRNQLSMTTGLDDGVPDSDCTEPTCLQYLADANTRWAYHNAPYTLLDEVMTAATGSTLNQFYNSRVKTPIGMNGFFVQLGYNNVLFTNARSMARFGLLLLNHGRWANNVLLSDTAYFNQMTHSSQSINPSYGYLTWLNGQSSYKLPGLQLSFPGALFPNAPADMYSALGKNGQIINIVPSQNLVMIRMGNNPDNTLVPVTYNRDIWELFNAILCNGCGFTPIISGSSTCCINSQQTYSVPNIAGSTYNWTVTGGTITNGQGTNQITVQWDNGTVGTVNVVQVVP